MHGALGNMTSIGDQSTERRSILLGYQIIEINGIPPFPGKGGMAE